MSKWLDLSNNANKIRQSYFKGFIDISGGGLYLRNDMSLNFYDTTNSAIPKFSIKSGSMRITDNFGVQYDVSNSQLLYIKELTSDAQSQLDDLANRTKYISSNSSNIDTMMEFVEDASGKRILLSSSIIPTEANTYDLGSADKPFASVYVNQGTIHFINPTTRKQVASLSFDPETGSLDLSTNRFVSSLNNSKKASTGETITNYDGKVGIGVTEPTSALDVSGSMTVGGNAVFSGSVSLLSGDLSMNGSLNIGTTIFEGGNSLSSKYASIQSPTLLGTATIPNVRITDKLSVSNDVSLNGNLFISRDVSLNNNLTVGGNLLAPTPITTDNSKRVATTEFVRNQLFAPLASPSFSGTVAMATSNVTQKLNVGGDVSFNSKLSVYSATTLNNKLSVGGDTTLTGNLIALTDASINGNVNVGGVLSTVTPANADNSSKVATTEFVKNQGYALVSGTSFTGDVSLNKRLFVNGDVSLNNKLFVNGDVSLNANVYVTTQPTSDNSSKAATTAFVKNQGYATLASPTFLGTVEIPVASISQNLLVTGDTSLNGTVQVSGNLTAPTLSSIDNSTKVATTAFVKNQGFAKIAAPTFTGLVSMSDSMTVANDTTLNHVTVLGDSSFNGNLNIAGVMTAQTQSTFDNSTKVATTAFIKNQGYAKLSGAAFSGDVAIQSKLVVSGDVSLNANVVITGDTTLNGGAYAITPNTVDNSTKIATTAYVQNQGYATVVSPSFTGYVSAPTPSIGDTSRQVATTEYVRTEITSFINSIPDAFDAINQLKTALSSTDASFALSLTGSLGLKADKASPTFSGVVTLPTAIVTNGLTVYGDVSLNNKVLFAGDISMVGLVSAPTVATSDNSTTVATTAFVKNQGYAQLTGANFTGTITATQINSTADASFNGNLSVGANIIANKNLLVSGDATIQNDLTVSKRLFVSNDASILGNLAITGSIISSTPINSENSTTVATTAFVKNQNYAALSGAAFTGDISLNTKLLVGGDVSMNGGNLFLYGSAKFNNTLDVVGDVSMNSDLFVSKNTNITGNLSVGQTIFENGSSLQSKYATLASPTFTGTVRGITKSMIDLSNVDNTSDSNKPISNATQASLSLKANVDTPTFTGLVTAPTISITDKLQVSSDVSLNGKLFVAGDVSMNGNAHTTTPATVDNSTRVATTEFVKNQGYISASGGAFNGNVVFNNSVSVGGDLSLNSGLFVSRDASFNSNVFIQGKTVFAESIAANGHVGIQGDVSLNGKVFAASDLSLNGNVNIGGLLTVSTPLISSNSTQVATTAFIKNQGYAQLTGANFTGDVSVNDRLFVSKNASYSAEVSVMGDVSMNSRLFINDDVSMNSRLFVNGKTVLSNDVSMNAKLLVSGDVSMNGKLFVSSDVSMNGNLSIGGTINVLTPSNNDNSTRVATTEFVKNLAYAPIDNPTFTGTTTIPTAIVSQNLIVNSDAYFYNNLNVTADATIGGNANITGFITSSTPSTNDNSTKVATTSFVKSQLFAPLASPTFTGSVKATTLELSNNLVVLGDASFNGITNTKTPSTNDNSTQVATTAFVKNQGFAPLASPVFTGTVAVSTLDISTNLVALGDVSINGNIAAGKTIYENGKSLSSVYATLVSPTFVGTVTGITKAMVDLSNVDNTSDDNKPVSTAQQAAINVKANIASPTFTGTTTLQSVEISNSLRVGGDISLNGNLVAGKTIYENGQTLSSVYATLVSPNFTGTVGGITKDMVGLTNVDNTSDLNKPISVSQQQVLDLKANHTNPVFSGIVRLPTADISQNVHVGGDISLNGNLTMNGILKATTPATNNISIQVATTEYVANQQFAKLSGAEFTGPVSMTNSLLVSGDVSLNSNLYVAGNLLAQTQLSTDNSKKVATTEFVKGLGFAKINSPSFTGIPTAPTALTSTSTTDQIATTKYVELKITDFFNAASAETLNAIQQVSQALQNTDSSFASALASQLALKANMESPTFTGTVTLPATTISNNLSINGDVSMSGMLIAGSTIYENRVPLQNTYAKIESPTFTGTVGGITKTMIGLANVDNTSDVNKPVSTLQQSALDLKADLASPTFTGKTIMQSVDIMQKLHVIGDISLNGNLIAGKTIYENGNTLASVYARLASPTFTGTVSGITKTMIDLSNVDNTADINKPISSAQQAAFDLKATIASPTFSGIARFAAADISQNLRVGGDVSLNGNLVAGKTIYENGQTLASVYATLASPIFTGTVSGITKAMVDLSNVDNTSDSNKPVSTAQQTALNTKANIASPSLTGSTTIQQNLTVGGDLSMNGRLYVTGDIYTTTPVSSDNSTKVATTSYVKSQNANNAQLTGAAFTGDVSINTRLFVGADTSLNGNLYVNGKIIGQYPNSSIPIAAIIGGLGTNVDLSTNQTINGLKSFVNDVSMGSRLNVAGNVSMASNNIVSSLYQTAVDPSSTTLSNLTKLTNNYNGTFITEFEISKSNGLVMAYNTTNGTPVVSINGGTSWAPLSITAGNTGYNGMLCISPAGRIQLKQEVASSTPTLYVSTDWGTSFNSLSLSHSYIYTNAFYGYNTFNDQAYAFSHDGNTLYFIARDINNTVVIWKNTNASFSAFTRQNLSWNYNLSNCPRAISTSSDGKYVLLITGIIPANGMFLYVSSDYGATYTKTANNLNSLWNSIVVSYSGRYQAATNNNNIYQSSDYGATWALSSAPSATWNSITMSNDGKNRVGTITNGYQYISFDYGATWTIVPNSLGNWKKSVMVDASNNNNITIYSHDGVNIYTNSYKCVDVVQKTTIGSDLNITTPSHYLNNMGKMLKVVKTNLFTSSDNGRKMGMSGDGKYLVLPVANKQSIFSQDYGETWNTILTSSQTDYNYAIVSGNGQYMFVRKGSTTYWSINSGSSWSVFTGVTTTDTNNGIAISYSGQYMVYAGLDSATNTSSVHFSTNSGSTWSLATTFPTSSTSYSAAISSNGQYISVISPQNALLTSTDYGATWVTKYTNSLTNGLQVAMSTSGQYQSVVTSTTVYISQDYGNTFTKTYSSSGLTSITMIGTGEYQYVTNTNENKLYRSTDFGSSWSPLITNISSIPSNAKVSRDGTFMMYGASGDIYVSRVADTVGTISSTAVSISKHGIVSALDINVNGTITTQNLVVNQVYENGNLLGSKYATINSPSFTGTVSGITKAMVDLSNVDNTSDMNKPLSTATQSALNAKANIASPTFTGTATLSTVSVSQNLLVSGDASLNGKLMVVGDVSLNGYLYANYAPETIPYSAIMGGIPSANGVFTFDISANSRLYVNNDVSLNSKLFVRGDASFNSKLAIGGDVSMGSTVSIGGKLVVSGDVSMGSNFAVGGDSIFRGKLDNYGDVSMGGNLIVSKKIYENGLSLASVYAPQESPVFSGTATVEKLAVNQQLNIFADSFVTGNVTVSKNIFAKTIYEDGASLSSQYAKLNSPIFTGDVSGITKSMVGLSNADNTSDSNKPISTAAQSALNLKAALQSPTFTGIPLAPTPISGTNNTQIATTQFVATEISNLIGTAPETLNTLQEIAAAINTDASFATTITTQIGLKATTLNPVFQGTVTIPTAIVTGDMSANSNFYLGKDASFNGKLYVKGKTTMNDDVSMNSNLVVGGDLSVNGFFHAKYPDYSIPSTAVENIRNQYGQLVIQTQRGDVVHFDDEMFETSFSSGIGIYTETLYSNDSDLSLNGNLHINGLGVSTFLHDVLLHSKLQVNLDTSMNGNLMVGKSIYENGSSLIAKYATLASPTFTGKVQIPELQISLDASMNGNLFVNQSIYENGSSLITKYATLASPTFTGKVAVPELQVSLDASMNGNLYVDKLLVTKDLSLNGNLYINYADSSIPPSAIIGGVSTGIFFKDISANSRLFLQGDASLNGKLFVVGDVSLNGKLNVDGLLTTKTQSNTDNSTLVATTAFVKNQGYATLSGAEFTGDVKLDNRLFVLHDASLNGNLYVDKGAKIMGEMMLNNHLDISGSIIAHTNVNVYGIINQYTTTLDEGYKVNYDTQVYIEQLQQQVATLQQQMANVLQILANNNIQ